MSDEIMRRIRFLESEIDKVPEKYEKELYSEALSMNEHKSKCFDEDKIYSKEQILLAISLIRKFPGKRGGGFRMAADALGTSDSGLSRYILKSGKLTAVGERKVYEKSQ